jgi:hypothetical protein
MSTVAAQVARRECRNRGVLEAAPVTPYTGPRPSPARPLAPWVILFSALLALGNAGQFLFNWLERGYQQQVRALNPPSVERIHNTISKIHTLGTFNLVMAAGYLIVAIMWSFRRRSRTRLNRDGEIGVEPALRNISPIAYWTMWVALAASIMLTTLASSHSHSTASVSDFIAFRTYLAFGDVARIVLWSCWIVLVAQATALQTRREAIRTGPRPVYASDTWSAPQPEPAAAAPTVPTAPTVPSVGWHPIENDPHRQAYWDGASWTYQKRWNGTAWVDLEPNRAY